MTRSPYRFAAAREEEAVVFGAARPGYRNAQVAQWIEFMGKRDIRRVCCLLSEVELARYSSLLETYREAFGRERVCWAAVEDFQLIELETLFQTVLPFLRQAEQAREKVVVHCAGGIGRTGQVLAAWLVHGRGLSRQEAVRAVGSTGRNPYEAAIAAPLKGRNPWRVLHDLKLRLEKPH